MIDKPLITLRSQTFLVARSMDGILPPNYLHGLAFMMGDIFVSINLGFIKDFLTGLVDLFSWFDVTVEIEVGVYSHAQAADKCRCCCRCCCRCYCPTPDARSPLVFPPATPPTLPATPLRDAD